VAPLTLSLDKVIIQLLAIVSSYLSPIFISCAIYVSLICIKERHFNNEINVSQKPEELSSVNQAEGDQNNSYVFFHKFVNEVFSIFE
jgi:hypothetical protein